MTQPERGKSIRVAVVYHSIYGHTAAVAKSVAAGAEMHPGAQVALINADDLTGSPTDTPSPWDALHEADAIIFGCPTYMGTVSAGMKRMMDATGALWMAQHWRDKLAAGFTVAAGLSGDKLNTLVTLSVFAAQHSMVWVSKGVPMDPSGVNRMGAYLGLMAQADNAPPDQTPPETDHETARRFGLRVAQAAKRWAAGQRPDPSQA